MWPWEAERSEHDELPEKDPRRSIRPRRLVGTDSSPEKEKVPYELIGGIIGSREVNEV